MPSSRPLCFRAALLWSALVCGCGFDRGAIPTLGPSDASPDSATSASGGTGGAVGGSPSRGGGPASSDSGSGATDGRGGRDAETTRAPDAGGGASGGSTRDASTTDDASATDSEAPVDAAPGADTAMTPDGSSADAAALDATPRTDARPSLDAAAPPDARPSDANLADTGPDARDGGPRHPLDVDPMLLGHWPLDEGSGSVARDQGPLGLDGAITGAAWTTGRIGGALSFDAQAGAGRDYVDCGDNLNALTLPLTLAAWIRPGASGTTRVVLATDYSATVYTGAWFGLNDNDELYAGIGRGTGTATDPVMAFADNQLIAAGSWVHVAAILLAPGSTQLFIDGAQVAASPWYFSTGAMVQGSGPIQLGSVSGGSSAGFVGDMDDVRLYDRALSAAEILALFQMAP